MPSDRTKKKGNWINADVLRWAREWRGRTIEEAARKVKKAPDDIVAWESNRATPTVIQARELADFYNRPFLEFVLPSRPTVPEPSAISDFRMRRGEVPKKNDRGLKILQQWAESQRLNALDLYEELGEIPPTIPARSFATIESDPDQTARVAREVLKFDIHDQVSLNKKEAEQLPTILRRRFESVGILTFRRSDLKKFGARGICLAEFPLPAIIFGNESPNGQSFTLAHELGHLLTRQSGISGPRSVQYRTNPVEKWADRFASAFLMPAEMIESVCGPRPSKPEPLISDVQLSRYADIFRVSPHAMLIRLVHLGYVWSGYYWRVKKPQFDADEREYKGGGRSKYYASRFRNQNGDLYTSLVLDAWASGRITNHNAGEFLGVHNFNQLRDIRDKFSDK